MGKKLIIKGADFSENAAGKDYVWQTVLSGSITPNPAGYSQYIHLERIVPQGTKTRLTWGVTGSGNAAIGGRDENNVSYSNFWHNPITSASGTVSDEKDLTFNLASIEIWNQRDGATITYLLEAYM